jgi:hypothetical protein
MTSYEFTLLVDRDATDEPYAEALFEVAEGGMIPEGGPAGNVVHVAQEAETLAEAITSTVHAVESVGVNVVGLQSDDLVSLKDIAARTGRTYESVRLLATGQRGPGGFPAPLSTGQWALYSWAETSAWFEAHFPATALACSEFDREIAAADHLLRARRMLAGNEQLAAMARLLVA